MRKVLWQSALEQSSLPAALIILVATNPSSLSANARTEKVQQRAATTSSTQAAGQARTTRNPASPAARYRNYLRQEIAEHWKTVKDLPSPVMIFSVTPSGKANRVSVEDGSRSSDLDSKASTMLREISFTPPPVGTEEIVYRIDLNHLIAPLPEQLSPATKAKMAPMMAKEKLASTYSFSSYRQSVLRSLGESWLPHPEAEVTVVFNIDRSGRVKDIFPVQSTYCELPAGAELLGIDRNPRQARPCDSLAVSSTSSAIQAQVAPELLVDFYRTINWDKSKLQHYPFIPKRSIDNAVITCGGSYSNNQDPNILEPYRRNLTRKLIEKHMNYPAGFLLVLSKTGKVFSIQYGFPQSEEETTKLWNDITSIQFSQLPSSYEGEQITFNIDTSPLVGIEKPSCMDSVQSLALEQVKHIKFDPLPKSCDDDSLTFVVNLSRIDEDLKLEKHLEEYRQNSGNPGAWLGSLK